MTAPEDRNYCADPWCDGDHLYSGQVCATDQTPAPSLSLSPGADRALRTIGRSWTRGLLGLAPVVALAVAVLVSSHEPTPEPEPVTISDLRDLRDDAQREADEYNDSVVLSPVEPRSCSTAYRPHRPCPTEDSAWCVWDHRHMGNHRGRSFWSGRTGVIHFVTHARAHSLIHGAR